MLSAETARGDFPLDAVRTMSRTAFEAQRQMDSPGEEQRNGNHEESHKSDLIIEEIVVRAAAQMANDANCKLIMAITESGLTAQLLAKYRPMAPVLSISAHHDHPRRRSMMNPLPLHPVSRIVRSGMMSRSEWSCPCVRVLGFGFRAFQFSS